MYDQRDIVLLPFPYTDLTGAKQRPALIISNKTINNSADRICCLVTSKRSKEGLAVPAKLPFKSWVKPRRVFTVHKDIIRKKLGRVPTQFHKKVIGRLFARVK